MQYTDNTFANWPKVSQGTDSSRVSVLLQDWPLVDASLSTLASRTQVHDLMTACKTNKQTKHSRRFSLEDMGINQEHLFYYYFSMLPVCACLHEFTCMERSKVNIMSSSEAVTLVCSVRAPEPGDGQEGQAGWSLSPTGHPVSPSQG